MQTLSCLAVILLLIPAAFAQSAAQADVPESKRKLIAELIEITGPATSFRQEFRRSLEDQKRIHTTSFNSDLFSDPSWSEAERKERNDKMIADMNRMFDRMAQRVEDELDFEGFAVKFLFQVYNKYYSEDDLKELIAFYRTPIGNKILATEPSIRADIMTAFETEMLPGIMKISKEVADEEMKDILKQP